MELRVRAVLSLEHDLERPDDRGRARSIWSPFTDTNDKVRARLAPRRDRGRRCDRRRLRCHCGGVGWPGVGGKHVLVLHWPESAPGIVGRV